MQKEQMSELLDHWMGRQEQGLVGLEFTGCPRTNYRRNDKHRKARGDVNDEEDEEDEEKGQKGQFPTTLHIPGVTWILS
jgi:hypothetical protein